MTTLGGRAVIAPPIHAPSRPNLLSSVSAEPKPTEGRWQLGIAYQPERDGTGGTGSIDPCGEVGGGTKTIVAGPGVVEWDPYIIWVGDECTTIGTDPRNIEARAIRHLEAQTSHLIETILWTNQVDSADFGASHPNVSLSDASIYPGDPDGGTPITTPNAFFSEPPVTAFKTMIEALTDALAGTRGMIHVERRMLPFLAFYGLAIQSGQRLVTTLGDHIIVPGTGYTGSSPEEDAAGDFYTWIYGTSMVEVLLSEIVVDTDLAGAVNRSTNLIEYRAERMALAHWDRAIHIGVSVCLEDPAGICSDMGS